LLALAEVRLLPRKPRPNLHVHANEDEMFFVLDGVMTVQVGDQLHEVAAGGLGWGAAFRTLSPTAPRRRCADRYSSAVAPPERSSRSGIFPPFSSAAARGAVASLVRAAVFCPVACLR